MYIEIIRQKKDLGDIFWDAHYKKGVDRENILSIKPKYITVAPNVKHIILGMCIKYKTLAPRVHNQ